MASTSGETGKIGRDNLLAYLGNHGPPALVSGAGGMIAIWGLAQLAHTLNQALLIAPFGASSVLLFALPNSPLARPRNVIGGHLLSSLIGLLILASCGHGAFACGLAVGLAIAAMQISKTLHPPAGADPLVVILTGAGWRFLFTPMLTGTVLLVLLALLYHRAVSRRTYPLRT